MLSYHPPLRRFFLLILPALFVLVLALPSPTLAGGGPPQLEKAQGTEPCIRPADWMRRNHMVFLKHRRAETVREGLRIRSESLQRCATCHTSHEKFCDRCHAYVGVAPGCFECHNYPK